MNEGLVLNKRDKFKQILEQGAEKLAPILPANCSPQQMVGYAVTAAANNPSRGRKR